MKIKIAGMCFLVMFVLTGCGSKGWAEEYLNAEDVAMIDTKEEYKEAVKNLDLKDKGQWVHRQENINQVISLKEKIEQVCEKGSKVVSYVSEPYEEDLDRDWDSEEGDISADLTKDFSKNKALQDKATVSYGIDIYVKDFESLKRNWNILSEIGFEELKNVNPNGAYEMVNGYCFETPYKEDIEEGGEDCKIRILIPALMLYGPERYFELADFCRENNLFVSNVACRGGVVDIMEIMLPDYSRVDMYIKDDKILEIRMENLEEKMSLSSSTQKSLVELVTKVCGERNDAIAFVKGLASEKRATSGTVGNRKWKSIDEDIIAME